MWCRGGAIRNFMFPLKLFCHERTFSPATLMHPNRPDLVNDVGVTVKVYYC